VNHQLVQNGSNHSSNDIVLLFNKSVSDIIESVNSYQVMSTEDAKFLQEHKEHFSQVMAKTHMWRTYEQKLSIVSDGYCPTLHAKFHQAILESKVQLDQSFYLAKDYELKKIEVSEKYLDLEELGDSKRDKLKAQKLEVEIQFLNYELQTMKTAMQYRMKEVRDWQQIQENLLSKMKALGMDDDTIWSKDSGEMISMFLVALTNLQGLKTATDSAERNNLLTLAVFSYNRIKEAGLLEEVTRQCNPMQMDSLQFIQNNL